MSQATWTQTDEFLSAKLAPHDNVLTAALEASQAADLPDIAVSPNQGKLLHVLAQSIGAKQILEVGTLGGYSSIWLARALSEGGHLHTLEFEPTHATVAQANLDQAGLADRVTVHVGLAIESLAKLHSDGAGPFDFVFIDADKPSIPDYFAWALKLTHPGSLIVVDNVVRQGQITDPENPDERVQGCQRFLELLSKEDRVSATVVQTVGAKGYDGFALATVLR